MKIWNEENIKIFYEYYNKISNKELAEKIGAIDPRTIEKYAKKVGIWKSKYFSDKDYKFADDNMFILTEKEIANILGKNRASVGYHFRKMGFYKNKDNYIWNDEKIEILKRNYERGNWEKLLEDLGTNNSATIFGKAKKLGLKRCAYSITIDEENFIIKNYSSMSIEQMSQELGRPLSKIKRKIINLKLDNEYFHWTDDEISLLKDFYPQYSNFELRKKFFPNFSESRLSFKAESLGLRKDYNKSKFNYNDILKKLKEVYCEIGRTPTIKELKRYGLPSFVTFKKNFDGYMNACVLAEIPINNSKIYSKATYLSKNKDICFSASEVIISDFLYDNNIKYRKEVFYKEVSFDTQFKNYQMDWLLFDGTIVEFFGLRNKEYIERMNKKIELCYKNDLSLISLYDKDIKKLNKIFEKYLLI